MPTLRLACRQNGRMSVSSTRVYASYFKLGATFNAQWSTDALLLEQCEGGNIVVKEPSSYRHDDYVRQLEFTPGGCNLPGFCVAEAVFEDMGNNILCWQRPPIWELPWNHRKSMQGDVGIDLKKRLDSARRRNVDLITVLARVPQWARDSVDWRSYQKAIFTERKAA